MIRTCAMTSLCSWRRHEPLTISVRTEPGFNFHKTKLVWYDSLCAGFAHACLCHTEEHRDPGLHVVEELRELLFSEEEVASRRVRDSVFSHLRFSLIR